MSKKGAAVIIDLIKIQDGVDGTEVGNIPMAGAAAVFYSEAIPLPRMSTFAINIEAESGGDVKLIVELESANEVPATEGAADSKYVVPDSKSEVIADLADELMHRVPYSPIATDFARLKISADTGNDASTVLSTLEISYIPAN